MYSLRVGKQLLGKLNPKVLGGLEVQKTGFYRSKSIPEDENYQNRVLGNLLFSKNFMPNSTGIATF